jgi:hypothetical protein
MTFVVPIDSGKIIEILFENSESLPENDYLIVMNLMKEYHETGDNENEIRIFISTKINNQELKKKIEKYLNKKTKDVTYDCDILKFCSCKVFGAICACCCITGFFILMAISILGVGVKNVPLPQMNATG